MKPKIHSRRPPGNKIMRKKTKQRRKKQTRKKQTRKKNTFVKKTRRKQRRQKQRTRQQKRRQTGGKPGPTLFDKIDEKNKEDSMPTTEDAREEVKKTLGEKYLTSVPSVQPTLPTLPTGTYTGTSSGQLDEILMQLDNDNPITLDTIPEGT